MPRQYQTAEVRTRGGLPLIAHYQLAPAEPDVGIMSEYFGDFYITTLAGKSADWLRLTAAEIRDIEEQVWEKV